MTQHYAELDPYDYTLPESLIAHEPANPRDSARLFVYHTATNTVTHSTVRDLPQFVAGSHLVYNDTTVVPARLHGVHRDGTPMELLVLADQGITPDGRVRALVNRGVAIGDTITVHEVEFTVVENHEKSMLLSVPGGEAIIRKLLTTHGETPLPPYIASPHDEAARRIQYQTIFAAGSASIAAPTASLHFTPALLESLKDSLVTSSPITLQVGLGTFAPIYGEHFRTKKLHEEHYFVPKTTAESIVAARTAGRPIWGVGTTVVRTLESAKDIIQKGEGVYDTTDLFIFPPYQFTYPDILMTNFHVPKSSLLCLVQAFIEHKGGSRHVIELYREAIQYKYRFYSFGDAMLIL